MAEKKAGNKTANKPAKKADAQVEQNLTRDEDGVLVDENGIPVLDLSAVENPPEVSRETAIAIPKWGWWLLLGLAVIFIVLSIFVPSQGLILGGSGLALAVFITHFGQDTLLESYEKRIKERYGDVEKVELSPEQRRELRRAIAEAEKQNRQEKKMQRAAKREAKRSGREYEEVLKEMKAKAKAEKKAEAAAKEEAAAAEAAPEPAAEPEPAPEPAAEPEPAPEPESAPAADDAAE